MEPILQDWVQLKGKGFLQKWKKTFCAVYARSHYGIERLELYPNEHDFIQGRHMRTILLTNCISVRMVDSGNSHIPLALQLTVNDIKTNQILLGPTTGEKARMWQDALCHAAFPDQYAKVTQSRSQYFSPQISPTSDHGQHLSDDYDTPWDAQQVHVMLIPTESSRRLGISEGTYDLTFGSEGVILKSDDRIVEAWDYRMITWFAYGANVCCFEAEENQTFEFKCANPDFVYEHLKMKVHLKPHFHPNYQPAGLKQAYFASYSPSNTSSKAQNTPRPSISQPAQNSPTRTIFAPRASIDTAAPEIYSVPNKSRHLHSPSWSKVPKDTKKLGKSQSVHLAPGMGHSPGHHNTSSGESDMGVSGEGKKPGKFKFFFGSHKHHKKGPEKHSETTVLTSNAEEPAVEWTFSRGDDVGVGEPVAENKSETPPSVPLKSSGAYVAQNKPEVPPRPQFRPSHDPLMEQLSKRLAERKEASHMPPPFPTVQEEPEEMVGANMPDVIANYRKLDSGRFRDSITSEPGPTSPQVFSVRNASLAVSQSQQSQQPGTKVPASRETTFESPAASPQVTKKNEKSKEVSPIAWRHGQQQFSPGTQRDKAVTRSMGNVSWSSDVISDHRHSATVITDV